MSSPRNRRTLYEKVDWYECTLQRKANCAICEKELPKGTEVTKVHYCQMPGFLIQHKHLCLHHEIPYLYKAGYGFLNADMTKFKNELPQEKPLPELPIQEGRTP